MWRTDLHTQLSDFRLSDPRGVCKRVWVKFDQIEDPRKVCARSEASHLDPSFIMWFEWLLYSWTKPLGKEGNKKRNNNNNNNNFELTTKKPPKKHTTVLNGKDCGPLRSRCSRFASESLTRVPTQCSNRSETSYFQKVHYPSLNYTDVIRQIWSQASAAVIRIRIPPWDARTPSRPAGRHYRLLLKSPAASQDALKYHNRHVLYTYKLRLTTNGHE